MGEGDKDLTVQGKTQINFADLVSKAKVDFLQNPSGPDILEFARKSWSGEKKEWLRRLGHYWVCWRRDQTKTPSLTPVWIDEKNKQEMWGVNNQPITLKQLSNFGADAFLVLTSNHAFGFVEAGNGYHVWKYTIGQADLSKDLEELAVREMVDGSNNGFIELTKVGREKINPIALVVFIK